MRFYNRDRLSEYVSDIKKDLSPARLSIRSELLRRPDALLKSIKGFRPSRAIGRYNRRRTDFSLKE